MCLYILVTYLYYSIRGYSSHNQKWPAREVPPVWSERVLQGQIEPRFVTPSATAGACFYTALSPELWACAVFFSCNYKPPYGCYSASSPGIRKERMLPATELKGHWFKSHLSLTTDVRHLSWPAAGPNNDSLIGKGWHAGLLIWGSHRGSVRAVLIFH